MKKLVIVSLMLLSSNVIAYDMDAINEHMQKRKMRELEERIQEIEYKQNQDKLFKYPR